MIVDLEDMSKEDLVFVAKQAIEQIRQLSDDKERLRKAIKKACEENNIKYIRGLVR